MSTVIASGSGGGRLIGSPVSRAGRPLADAWTRARLPRPLHAGAWWLWALCLAAAASRTTNPILLGLIIAVAALVVAARRTDAPWGGSFNAFLKLGLVVIAIRVVFQAIFGGHVGGSTVMFHLPELTLPAWAEGLKVGGPITAEATVLAFYDGLRLATILACLGAANALADARRLLRSMPGALYEAGVALVVAMTFAPRLVADARRVRHAHRLRGRRARGVRALGRVAMPVLEGSLDRALEMAAAMDSRGFGRTAVIPPRRRRTASVLVLAGLLGVCVGLYGLLDGGAASRIGPYVLLSGVAAAIGGLVIGGHGSARTRYRPDPWGLPEWGVTAAGAITAATFAYAVAIGMPGMNVFVVPLVIPAVPLLPLVGVLVALTPAVIAPRPVAAGGTP